ncbi:hypothetical protein E2C01_066168 [Portunus trituberculatus]|uniref:Uncharacterized protein n=1 Tax=Portunus trituberculatus TaxID=210409 RepID=A0A5B7HT47_PORTR|nr:hypothetical protein [Portunus trituberculatus]
MKAKKKKKKEEEGEDEEVVVIVCRGNRDTWRRQGEKREKVLEKRGEERECEEEKGREGGGCEGSHEGSYPIYHTQTAFTRPHTLPYTPLPPPSLPSSSLTRSHDYPLKGS